MIFRFMALKALGIRALVVLLRIYRTDRLLDRLNIIRILLAILMVGVLIYKWYIRNL